jgi:ABC-type cobalamin transport system permease subunit
VKSPKEDLGVAMHYLMGGLKQIPWQYWLVLAFLPVAVFRMN